MRKAAHVSVQRADFKRPLGLVEPQYTTHYKNAESKYATGLGVMIGRGSPDSQHGRPIVTLRMLAVLLSGTQITILGSTQIRDTNTKHGLGKTTNLHNPAILGATLHKEDIGKE